MVSGRTRKIVVIKDVPSNIIEEAIFILKCDAEDEAPNKPEARNRANLGNDFILKEAYSVIENYIKERKNSKNREMIKVFGIRRLLKSVFSKTVLINLFAFGVIALLFFLALHFI